MTYREHQKASERSVGKAAGTARRSVTIKDLAQELGLSITTISRALGGYSDVGQQTRERVTEAARRLGFRPNRNAQRLVTRRTHNVAWVQPDDDLKFLDPHFAEVMSGALRGARLVDYDIVVTSHTPERELDVYDRYVKDNSVDGFIVDLPREGDRRIDYLLGVGRPFVVHGRERPSARYGWVDVDNFGNFYRLVRLMIANGHRRIAFINGDEQFTFALHRHRGAVAAIEDAGLPPGALVVLNLSHPTGDAAFDLTVKALADPTVTAIIYSSVLVAIEGIAAVDRERPPGSIALAAMNDELHYLDLSRIRGRLTFARTSLRAAGMALIQEIARQCDDGAAPRSTLIPTSFEVHPALDGASIEIPLPRHRHSAV